MKGEKEKKKKERQPKANRERKLINVFAPLLIKEELTHKYSQNSKVRWT